jgi:HK97 family phage portal protein
VATQPPQFGPGVLLDATGNPMQGSMPPALWNPAAPPGSYLPEGQYGPTTIIVDYGGGHVELTDADRPRTISYADIFASQPAVAAVIGKLVRQISTIPLKVYKRPANGASQNGKPKMPEEQPDHPLSQLIEQPCPGYGAVSLKEWIAMPLLVHGNSLIAKFREDGPGTPPTELFPLDWRFLQAWARIGQPVIVWATVQTGVMKWIAPSETVYTAWVSPAGPNGAWLGTSPLAQLAQTIKIDEAAQRFAAQHFQHGARPGLIVTLPPTANTRQNPEILKRIEEQTNENYAGVDKAYKTLVLGGGADAKPLAQTADEAQLTQTRTWDRDEVRDVFDMPPAGDTNSPEADAQLYKTTLRPIFHMICDRANAQLVRPEPEWVADGVFLKFDPSETLWGDPLVLSDKLVAEVSTGITTRNEARFALGRDPHPNKYADELIVDANSEGILGTLPGSLSVGEEEREMVMPLPGTQEPLQQIDTSLGDIEGG